MTLVSPSRVSLPRIGAQVSAAGGLLNAVARAIDIGAEVVQVFSGNPRQWRGYVYSEEQLEAFRLALRESGLLLFVHTIYLINLAGPDPTLRERSTQALAGSLVFASRTGAAGVVTHVGSHRGDGIDAALPRVREGVLRAQETAAALCGTADLPPSLLESSAGGGHTVGRDPTELGLMMESLAGSSAPVGLCLDTAHLFAAGVALNTSDGLGSLIAALTTTGCLDAVRLIHLNDSRTPLGSHADRHENLGEGELGLAGLAAVVQHPAFRCSPFVLEVPGLDGHGPDAENIRRAQAMRYGSALPSTPIP